MEIETKNVILAISYFGLSTIITTWFILQGIQLYNNTNTMILSGSIAGAKWALQIATALLFLGKTRWLFIRRIALVCLIGSLLLFSYYPIGYIGVSKGLQFIWTLEIAVLGMLIFYFKAVTGINLPMKWFVGWVCCLIIAITLQLTVVFHII